jgi:hypothetical protein
MTTHPLPDTVSGLPGYERPAGRGATRPAC